MAETEPDIDAVPSLNLRSGMFAIASLFAIVGDFLDAYSYLARGHVFANAQTGFYPGELILTECASFRWTHLHAGLSRRTNITISLTFQTYQREPIRTTGFESR